MEAGLEAGPTLRFAGFSTRGVNLLRFGGWINRWIRSGQPNGTESDEKRQN